MRRSHQRISTSSPMPMPTRRASGTPRHHRTRRCTDAPKGHPGERPHARTCHAGSGTKIWRRRRWHPQRSPSVRRTRCRSTPGAHHRRPRWRVLACGSASRRCRTGLALPIHGADANAPTSHPTRRCARRLRSSSCVRRSARAPRAVGRRVPAWRNSRAAVRPANPPPMTMTSRTIMTFARANNGEK